MPVRQSLEVFQSCNIVNTFRNGVDCLIGFPEFLYTSPELKGTGLNSAILCFPRVSTVLVHIIQN